MVTGPPASVLDALGLRPRPVTVLKDAPGENANWLARTSGGQRVVNQDVSVHNDIDWRSGAAALLAENPRLGSWACAAAERTRAGLAAIGAGDMPVTVVHGDFAEWNVHYSRGGLAGVVDFGLAHLDSRPYELAIARTYRAPEAIAAYRAELAARGWPLSELEECAIEPVYQAFRGDMAAWAIEQGRRTGRFDLAMIERQLARTGTPPP